LSDSISPIVYLFFSMLPPPPTSPLFPYTTLFRSQRRPGPEHHRDRPSRRLREADLQAGELRRTVRSPASCRQRPRHPRRRLEDRSEEHTSELQSQSNLVCRLLLEKKKQDIIKR